MIVQEPVQAAIWHCLNHYDYTDAIFLSERLHAEVKNDDSLFLLATAFYRNGQLDHAYHLLKDREGSSPACKYLFGKCAYKLERYAEAEAILLENSPNQNYTLDDVVTEYGDQASFTLLLLGKIAAKTERRPKAVEAFKKALKLNPFLWSGFVNLCKLGEQVNPNSVFQLSDLQNLSSCHGSNYNNVESLMFSSGSGNENIANLSTPQMRTSNCNLVINCNSTNSKFCTPEQSPLAQPLCLSGFEVLGMTRHKNIKPRNTLESLNVVESPQPSFGILHDTIENYTTPNIVSQTTLIEANEQKSLAKRMRAHVGQLISRKEILQNSKTSFSQSGNVTNSISMTPSVPTTVQTGQNVRRSSRLFTNSYSVKENNKSPNRNKFQTPKSPSRKTKQRISKNINKNATYTELNARNKIEKEKSETVTSNDNKTQISAINNNSSNCIQQQATYIQKQSAEGLMSLLRDMGQAYLHLSQYDCKAAVEELNSLPSHQFQTTWVYSMLGLAYFEMADYENCIKYFSETHSREPYRLEYMDIYSTALWHLQKEVALSALAQDLVNLNKNSPVTWCVNGNCFSLHKEHDTAIKFFHRAVQVDRNFPYAYTLLGHEYIVTEELDKAMSCFRNAIRLDPRHYNAWFGIGTIYSKQERYHLAEINYNRASSINAHNSVIMCHISVVQHALKDTEKALQTLNRAIAIDPKSPLCKFHRGSIYFAVGRHAEALKELEELKQIVPKESLVYYLIGKVHKKIGNTDLALMHFSWATDLDPKGASSQIKEAFDPSAGRNSTETESATPAGEDYQSEGNSLQQQDALAFVGLPEDSEDSY